MYPALPATSLLLPVGGDVYPALPATSLLLPVGGERERVAVSGGDVLGAAESAVEPVPTRRSSSCCPGIEAST